MKNKYYPPTKEVAHLFSFEWKRAKQILKPMLDHKKIPKLYLASSLRNGWAGLHSGSDGTFMIRLGKRWVRNSHAIALRDDMSLDEMKHTIRHEICHCLGYPKHKFQFKNALKGLERAREFEESMGVKA